MYKHQKGTWLGLWKLEEKKKKPNKKENAVLMIKLFSVLMKFCNGTESHSFPVLLDLLYSKMTFETLAFETALGIGFAIIFRLNT